MTPPTSKIKTKGGLVFTVCKWCHCWINKDRAKHLSCNCPCHDPEHED